MCTPRLFLTAMLIAFSQATSGFADEPKTEMADVNHVKIHYLISGKGDPIVLLHGYAEISRMWLPLMKELEKTHTVIAPELRGAGESSTPQMVIRNPPWPGIFRRWWQVLGIKTWKLSATISG